MELMNKSEKHAYITEKH